MMLPEEGESWKNTSQTVWVVEVLPPIDDEWIVRYQPPEGEIRDVGLNWFLGNFELNE